MTTWAYNEQDEESPDGNRVVTVTEAEVLATYGPYFRDRCEAIGIVPTDEECIENWAIVNWAWKL